jgi:hypothetical protein
LVVERDARPLRECERAAVDAELAGQHPKQRRLPGAVRPGEGEPVAALDLERDAVEQRVSRDVLAELVCDYDCHRMFRSGASSALGRRQPAAARAE